MASLTIRNLDEESKKLLKLRAARNGRSMEEEARALLRDATMEAASVNPGTLPSPGAPAAMLAPAGTKRVVLIIGGGIAAYKSLDLIRRLRERGARVRVIMTNAAQQFVTPLAAGALTGEAAFTDLFDPDSEFDVGHIRLARDTDLVLVAPATADLMAKMAQGLAGDLATAVLLATKAPVLIAPAMNPAMWRHKATQRNLAQLKADGVITIGPNAGEMAESGESGTGRMAEPLEIAAAAMSLLGSTSSAPGPLAGKRVLVTSGPTHEPIDPVRYIANRSSGKQGHAIAEAAAKAGAEVILVSGPVNVPDPAGVKIIKVESARDMLAAVQATLPVDAAVFAAAVADWRVAHEGAQKMKKTGKGVPELALVENPDILATIAKSQTNRPSLVVGFAAETEIVIEHAKAKLARKGCDWIVANDVSPQTGIMGGDRNTVHLITQSGVESWPSLSKTDVATQLVERIGQAFSSEVGTGSR